ncbi:hypothetical protein C8R44DRAFT_928236 [Mycena epipterygia]|nr:hypothetical protein C8R44DRAFT_928236 [Mycena epipterygia]
MDSRQVKCKHLSKVCGSLNAPSWMLNKLSGTYISLRIFLRAPQPSPGPHKLREFLLLTVFLRNRLKYALTGKEVLSIVKQQLIEIDNKIHTDTTFSTGFMGASPLRSYRTCF